MNLLILHPIIQLAAIAIAFYTAYLGVQRARSLHFGAGTTFKRNLHAALGATALITLMGGMAGGLIMVARVLERQPLESLHGKSGMVLLFFILIGIFTGFSLYFNPPKGKLLSAVHGINNLIILVLVLFQLFTGWGFYLSIAQG